MIDHFILPDRLDSSAASTLMQDLKERRGAPLALDAAGVEVVGALAFEVIISAGRQWQADGHPLTIARSSDRFIASCEALGLPAEAPWRIAGDADRGVPA